MEIKYKEDGLEINGVFLSLDEITNNVNNEKIKNKELCLMTIEWSYSRNFDGAYEKIVLPLESAKRFKEVFVGVEIYFGEIAGKHSEIYGDLEENEITTETDMTVINDFLSRFPYGRDFNHSFIDVLSDSISDGSCELMSSEEFEKLLKGEKKWNS